MFSVNGAAEHLQFRPWLVQQISSGKYKDLEWIDDDRKRIFKLPWTKKNYPNWEEHHQIFIAWAKHRANIKKDAVGGEGDTPTLKHVSLLKSNFRTILRKCCDIEELQDFHQLGLQTGNYKVYKILDPEEAQRKRSVIKRQKSAEPKTIDIVEITTKLSDPTTEINNWLPDGRIPNEWIAASGTMGLAVLDQSNNKNTTKSEQNMEPSTAEMDTFVVPDKITQYKRLDQFKVTKPRQSPTKLENDESMFDSKEVVFLPDQSIGSQVVIFDDSAPGFVNMEENGADNGFQMLLEAAEISDDTLNEPMAVEQEIPNYSNIQNIKDILKEMNIPIEQLDQYEIRISYNQTEVISNIFDEMVSGYRIHYGDHADQRFWVRIDEPERLNLKQDFDRTPITLPHPVADPLSKMTSSFMTVLEKVDAGVVLYSDNHHQLYGKRLCQSRVFAFSDYGDCTRDEIFQMERYNVTSLFSYQNFLEDVSQYINGKGEAPDCEIKLALGKRPRDRHSKIFIGVSIIPKAAQTILEMVEQNNNTDELCISEEKSIDKIIRFFM